MWYKGETAPAPLSTELSSNWSVEWNDVKLDWPSLNPSSMQPHSFPSFSGGTEMETIMRSLAVSEGGAEALDLLLHLLSSPSPLYQSRGLWLKQPDNASKQQKQKRACYWRRQTSFQCGSPRFFESPDHSSGSNVDYLGPRPQDSEGGLILFVFVKTWTPPSERAFISTDLSPAGRRSININISLLT